ncbi:MAG: hypothetical protein HY701_03345 [Gemmatimonadetes bacterium]|nr:hypothetical protein [Gemmatimonadota bacterium]
MDKSVDFHPQAIWGMMERKFSEEDVEAFLDQSDRSRWRRMSHAGGDTYSVRGQTSHGRDIQVVFVDRGGYLLVMGVYSPL